MDIEKYRTAAIVAQSGLLLAQKLLNTSYGQQDISQICAQVDQFLLAELQIQYKTVNEKGLAAPTEICKGDFTSGIAPEISDEFKGGIVQEDDVVKISLAVHIDGYTVTGAHTVVIKEETPSEPLTGTKADICIASYLANEAVISMLCTTLTPDHPLAKIGPVTGVKIQQVVNEIATAFDCCVVPGSQIRRITRFVSGQPTVQERNSKSIVWHEEGVNCTEFTAEPDQAWLIDVAMASKHNNHPSRIRRTEFNGYGSRKENPTVYARDYSITYTLKSAHARALIGKVDDLSVYPFRLGQLASNEQDLQRLKLGLNECIQRRLLVAQPRLQAKLVTPADKIGKSAEVAREATTIVLVSAAKSATGYPEALRLTGGKQFPPSWLHSKYELPSGEAADLLNARLAKMPGFKFMEVKGKLPEDKMDIE